MTTALYHQDGTQLLFTAQVSGIQGSEVALDASAFYPAGGGQPGDVGRLRWHGAESAVLATRKDKATGVIWHQLSGELPAQGSAVTGEVDAATRWRHTQRHSGEHLLAQAFKRVSPVFEVAAVSMNGPECHLDLTGSPAESQVLAAENLLRETLGRAELTLQTPLVCAAELASYPLRRATKLKEEVRLVIFSGPDGQYFDVSACGGTHVPRAAMCAPVVILRTERIKGGLTRVTFMAGEEAGKYLSGVYREAKALAQGFSVPVERLPERVMALSAERDSLKAAASALRGSLAQSLVAATPVQILNGLPVRFVELADPALLQPVLGHAATGEIIVALAPAGRCGVAAGSAAVNAGELLRSALAKTGGKGGGKADLAQGSAAQPDGFFAAVRTLLYGLRLNSYKITGQPDCKE